MFTQTSSAIDLQIAIAPVRRQEEKPKAQKIQVPWFGQDHADNYLGRCRRAIEMFMLGKPIKRMITYGHRQNSQRHIMSTRNNGTELWMFKDNPSIKVSVCVAKKVNGAFIGNSSGFAHFRSQTDGKIKPLAARLKIQEVCAEAMPMVPFLLFKEAQLDLNSFTMIDRGADEMLDLGRKEGPMHFQGAMLFKVEFNRRSKGLRGDAEYYLFDIDRNDLKLKNFNAFLSKLAGPAKTIAEAYDNLKPKEVADAERFLGRPCERQGEWFFIPVQGNFLKAKEATYRGGRRDVEAVLQSKGNRAHYVEKLSEEGYVRGKVSHGGHEHKPIFLEGWHKAVPNTAVSSFKISGAVD